MPSPHRRSIWTVRLSSWLVILLELNNQGNVEFYKRKKHQLDIFFYVSEMNGLNFEKKNYN